MNETDSATSAPDIQPAEPPRRCFWCSRGLMRACFALGLTLLGLNIIGLALMAERVVPIQPPAGQVLAGTAPFRFAVVSDSHGYRAALDKIIQRVKADKVSLFLHCGDLGRRYTVRQYDWVLDELGEQHLPMPFCPVPGNHDIDKTATDLAGRYALYRRAFGPNRYWFAYANTLFVAFDNAAEVLSKADLAWLGSVLEEHRAAYKACIVYTHLAPRDPRPGRSHALHRGDGEALMALLHQHNVTALFCGHIHSYLEDKMEGVPIYISGGGGGGPDEPYGPFHYLLCTVQPDGTLTVQKNEVGELTDWESPEYHFKVNLPNVPTASLGAVLLLAGFVLAARRRKCRV